MAENFDKNDETFHVEQIRKIGTVRRLMPQVN